MPPTSIHLARIGQAYAKKEAAYGTVPALAATNAFRHKALTFPGSDTTPKREIIEKQQSPGQLSTNMTAERSTASFNLSAILRPSGTINTLPELDPFLECGFGTKSNVTLATTVASGGGVSGATLASTVGLVVKQPLLITCPDGKKRIRFIATLPGADAVTWEPQLPAGQGPANGAAVKSGIVYKFTQQNLLSLSIAHYLKNLDGTAGLSRALSGAHVNKLQLNFDANDDPMLVASGAAKLLDGMSAPAQPGSFTTVGGLPPSGINGELVLGNTAAKFLKLAIDIDNGLKLRSESYGYGSAEETYRSGRLKVNVGLDMRATSQTQYDLAVAGTNLGVFLQAGVTTEGVAIAAYMPQVLFGVPDTDDPDDEVNFPFKGRALESADSAMDQLFLALC
jgi:hypothetical protein